MTILVLSESMRISVEENKILTMIVKLVDGTPLWWHLHNDTCVYVGGKRELLYELLVELTTRFFCKIEIC